MPDDVTPPVLDQVQAGVDQIQHHLEQARLERERQSARLAAMEAQLADAEDRDRRLLLALETCRRDLTETRQQAQAQQERADHFAQILQQLHGNVRRGGVYQWILQACLSITQASRGLYLTVDGPQGALRVRASVEIDVALNAPASPRIQALCHRTRENGETFAARSPADFVGLPPPERPTEEFQNCIVAPVVLLRQMHGFVLVADKSVGTFGNEDVQTLLHVGNEAATALENETLRRQLEDAYLATVRVLADAMEAKDAYTQGHSDEVSRYADRTARRLNLSEYDRSVVSYAALLHDVGKIGVSDGVLNKPGPLLPEERALVRSHVRVGADLLRHVPVLQPVADVVLHHHEWYNGAGYPDGLRAEEIPIAARIVAVVDAYSAMITRRSYKEPYSQEYARQELKACAATQFDPDVVEAFLTVLDEPDDEQDILDLDHGAHLWPLGALFLPHN